MNRLKTAILTSTMILFSGCGGKTAPETDRQIFDSGSYPAVAKEGDTYYLMMPGTYPGMFAIYSSRDPEAIGKGTPTVVWKPVEHGFKNIWSPELHRIGGKWYIYFEADDGNTDNHHLYVIENPSEDPTKGLWTLHGPIMTNEDWNYGIHPSVIEVKGRRYLFWSGWERRRTETETQCIFIAEMENPWTLKSERVLISRPDHEWERQWINPDGTRSAYPIFVNENPEPYLSPDGRKVIVAYSASGIWTVYSTLGMLIADADSDLLNPKSWRKKAEPQFVPGEHGKYQGASNIALVKDTDDKGTILYYQAKKRVSNDHNDAVIMRRIEWQGDSVPVFGTY